MSFGDFAGGMFGHPPVTSLWRPLNGMAVGQVAKTLEVVRRTMQNDNVYTREDYYGFSLESPALSEGRATFIFPNGIQSYSRSRVYRQSTSMTLGGIVAEEQGLAYIDLNLEVDFGIMPKTGIDTTHAGGLFGFGAAGDSSDLHSDMKKVTPGVTGLSGPKWAMRLMKHIFDRYHELKANAAYGHDTRLVFHNYKDGEHFVVIPQKVDLDRSVNSPMNYPIKMKLRAIADAPPLPKPKTIPSFADVVNGIKNVGRMARKIVALANDSALTLGKMAGEARNIIAVYDSILSELERGIEAWSTVGAHGRRTADTAREFAESLRDLAETGLEAARASPYTPPEVLNALAAAVDAADSMAAATAYSEPESASALTSAVIANAASGVRSEGDVSYPDPTYGRRTSRSTSYASTTPITVSSTDTLESLAAEHLGSSARWMDIVILNKLSPPYYSLSGIPGTVGPGSIILVPKAGEGSTTLDPVNLYYRDIKVYEVPASKPGRPLIDLKIDPRTGRDLATIEGVDNLKQAIQLRVWTPAGTLIFSPGYGMPDVIGNKAIGTTVSLLRDGLRDTLSEDSRVDRVVGFDHEITDDFIDFDVSVQPTGAGSVITVPTAVV